MKTAIKIFTIVFICAVLIHFFIQKSTFIYFDKIEFQIDDIYVNYQYKHDPFNCFLDCPTQRKITFSDENNSKSIILELDVVGINHLIFQEIELKNQEPIILVQDLAGANFYFNYSTFEAYHIEECGFPIYNDYILDKSPYCWDSTSLKKCYGIVYVNEFIKDKCSFQY